jgi:hypothetical protein
MTEDEAKKKYCVHQITSDQSAPKCDGSMCMAWRWRFRPNPDCYDIREQTKFGYCGLAGKPEGVL